MDDLAYAGNEWDEGKYQSFLPEGDNIMSITDGDDIVVRFVDFIKTVYDESTQGETSNLSEAPSTITPMAHGGRRFAVASWLISTKTT
ncbi:MAG: hypothetical protein LBU32_20190 [Clostridiales bacterium]|nr:hypothetical protein [Clostridiales bacterium]